jgi:hypothetical protein
MFLKMWKTRKLKTHVEDPILNIKFTKRTFEDARHLVVEVSPNLRRELVALRKIKNYWNMCKVEDFVVVTICLKCLGFGHTSRFCQSHKKCSYCAEDYHWKESVISTKLVAQTVSKQTPTSTTRERN